jgi:hypothetical protein
MARGSDAFQRYIRRLAGGLEAEVATDAALLGCFIAQGNERAFAALVREPGPRIRGESSEVRNCEVRN